MPAQRRIAKRKLQLIAPTAWVIDDVSVPKDEGMSVAVAPQYCGALWRTRRLPGRGQASTRQRQTEGVDPLRPTLPHIAALTPPA